MTTRLYTPEDYPTVKAWWDGHGQIGVPAVLLPKCGVMVEVEDKPGACVWIYFDNSSPMCWLTLLVSNPEIPPFKIVQAMKVLIEAALVVIKEQGYVAVCALASKGSQTHFMESLGFVINHPSMTQLFREVT